LQVQVEPLQVWLLSQQLPPQLVLPAVQHRPVMQVCVPQELPQMPQLALLMVRSTHALAQQDWLPHDRPQDPQLPALVLRSTQVPLHPVCPVPQQVPPEQLPLVHSTLSWHAPPLGCLVVHLLTLQ
jgi:hypothetical protein